MAESSNHQIIPYPYGRCLPFPGLFPFSSPFLIHLIKPRHQSLLSGCDFRPRSSAGRDFLVWSAVACLLVSSSPRLRVSASPRLVCRRVSPRLLVSSSPRPAEDPTTHRDQRRTPQHIVTIRSCAGPGSKNSIFFGNTGRKTRIERWRSQFPRFTISLWDFKVLFKKKKQRPGVF